MRHAATGLLMGCQVAHTQDALRRLKDPAAREFEQLLEWVHEVTGVDFSGYKEDTLMRRLNKRMTSVGMVSMASYLAWARRRPEELRKLQQMFLVSVSSFFRDADSFAALRQTLERHLADKPAGEPVRIWVPGCARGEEAYTLAILLNELTHQHPIQIVATDLNVDALAVAERAVYGPAAFKEVDARLLGRYTQQHGGDIQVLPAIRECVRFEERDVLARPSIAELDLVSCRNLLIYMKTVFQDRLMDAFHRVLRPEGLLFIGQCESLGLAGQALFSPVDHDHRVFRRRSRNPSKP